MKKIVLGFITVCLSICALAFAGCSVFADPHDGKCDICGKKTNQRYAGKETCWDCYWDIQKYWEETH